MPDEKLLCGVCLAEYRTHDERCNKPAVSFTVEKVLTYTWFVYAFCADHLNIQHKGGQLPVGAFLLQPYGKRYGFYIATLE